MPSQTREVATWLYVPADRVADLLPKAAAAPDGVVIDLEDAVHPSARPAARTALAETLTQRQPVPVAVRVNHIGSADFAADVTTVAPLVAAGLVDLVRQPKVESAADVAASTAAFAEAGAAARLVALLESARGVRHADEIAGAPDVAALTLGESDLRADLGLPRGGSGDAHGDDGLLLARMTVVQAARAAGLPAPVASVFANVRDADALAASCTELRRLGFYGRSVIHPAQIEVVRRAFAPSERDVAWARSVLDRATSLDDAGGAAAALSDGSFVDPAIVRQAEAIASRADRLAAGAGA